ncbi:thioredoxin-disulfide reductase [Candidatus Bathyarchaeota archaeon]|nr:MAG: thioredoxin-disulfide reductase [Candidatus Bathyarchaeota archaeon]
MEKWELLIIGAGAAGLTAGLYGARSGLKTLIIDEKMAGGTAVDAPVIENYPGFTRISGRELMQRMVEHAKRFGVEIRELEKAEKLELDDAKRVITDKNVYEASAIVIATGTRHRKLGVPGEEEFSGRGVSYCAVCDAPFFKGKRVLVIGGGNSAATTALYLSELASTVKLAHRRNQLRAEEALVRELRNKKNVEILWNTQVKEIKGDNLVRQVLLHNNKTGENVDLEVDGVFVQVGEVPNSEFAREAGIAVNEAGYIIVDFRQRTNREGVYAAGDVTDRPVKQIGTAVGEGIIAATDAYGYIRRPYYYKA